LVKLHTGGLATVPLCPMIRSSETNKFSHSPPETMFSITLTDPKSFGATYQQAILSVLPMDDDYKQHGLNLPEIKTALGLSNDARTSLCLMMKTFVSKGLVRRYDYKTSKGRIVSYKRLLPLRKREILSRWIQG